MLNIQAILKIINSNLENVHGCDFTNDIFCNCCGESKCDENCFITKLKTFFANKSTDVKEFASFVHYIAHGELFYTKSNDIFFDGCVFCDSNSDHRKYCPTRLMRVLIDYKNDSEEEVFVKINTCSNVEESLKMMHQANLKHSNYLKQVEINKINSVTCRYCERVFGDKSGKRQHERTNKICSDKFYTAHPEARK